MTYSNNHIIVYLIFNFIEEDLENSRLTEEENNSLHNGKMENRKLVAPQVHTQVDIETSNAVNPSDSVECVEGMELTMQRYRTLCFIRILQTLRRGVTLFWKFFLPVGWLIGGLIVSKNLTKTQADKTLAQTKPLLLSPNYYVSLKSGQGSFRYGTVPKFLMHDTVSE